MSDRRRSYYNNKEVVTNLVIAPDGGWGWFIVFSAFLNFFVIDGANFTFGIYLLPLSQEFDKSVAETALLGSVMGAISYLIGPFVSALLNNYDFRFVAIVGTLFATGGHVGASFATSYWFFFAFYSILTGFGYGMMLLPAFIAPNCYFLKWRALATSLSTCGTGVGTMILPPLLTFLLKEVEWRNTLRIMAGIILVFGLFGSSYKPLKPQTVVNLSKTKESYYKNSLETELRRKRCCGCCIHSNKYYPTTSEIVSVKGAVLENFELPTEASDTSITTKTATRRISRRITRFSIRQSLERESADISRSAICCYNFLYAFTCQPCQIDHKPFHRDDIFYDHSISLMPKYKTHAVTMKAKLKAHKIKFKGKKFDEIAKKLIQELHLHKMKYHMEVTRVTMGQEHWWKPNCRCSLSFLRTLQTMLHCDLYKSCAFNCLTASVFCYSLGYSSSLIYLINRATHHGISRDSAFWLLSAVGVSSTTGRIFCGVLPCVVPINICLLIVSTTAFAGVCIIASNFCHYYWFQLLFCLLHGFNSCTNICLRAVITVELFGIENLNNAFGIQMMFAGMAMLMGPVIGGGLYDYSKVYFWTYIYSGTCIFGCAIFIALAKLLRRREIEKEKIIQLLEEIDPATP